MQGPADLLGGAAVDDALMVTNLVYFGTLMIGGVLLVFVTAAMAITLVIAGAGQGVASLAAAAVRAVLALVGRARLQRSAAPEEAPGQTEEARAEYARRAVVAKADALLAAKRAAAAAASEAAAGSRSPRATEAEDVEPADEEIAIPVLVSAPAAREAQPEPARTSEPAVVARMRPARPMPARPGPHTGTQPILVVSRAS